VVLSVGIAPGDNEDLARVIKAPLVLSVGIAPGDNEDLARVIKAPLTPEGFFLEAHVKLRPVELGLFP